MPALISHTLSPHKQYVVALGAVPISSNYLLQLLQSATAFYLIKQPSAFCRETINHLIKKMYICLLTLVISEKEKEAKDVKEKGSREKREEESKGATVCQISAL